MPYVFKGADEWICDFFAAVERACSAEGVDFVFDAEDIELEEDSDDEPELPG